MKTYDLHGMTREEAVAKIRMIFLTARESGDTTIKVITGKGSFALSEEVIEMCEEEGLDWYHPPRNTGTIIIQF